MMNQTDSSSDEIKHEFGVDEEFEECPAWEWKITNRMVDVDTGELLYRLTGIRAQLNIGQSRIVTESELKQDYEQMVQLGKEDE